jgi:uncharacterized membrane protein
MKNKNQTSSREKRRQDKKDIVLRTRKKNNVPLILAGALAVLLIVGGFVYFKSGTDPINTYAEPYPGEPTAGAVHHAVELFEDGRARHFSFRADDGITIKYFVLKSSDGVIRAAFDACDVCWPSGKGYFQSGDSMVCRNCGRRFASVLVNEVKGGCNPAPLKRRIENERVILEIADILEGGRYFDFSGRIQG